MTPIRWPAWLARRPTRGIRASGALALAILAAGALLIPSNLATLPPLAALAAVGVGGAIAGSGMVVWERRPGNPIGPLLVVAGMLWILGRTQGADPTLLGLAANLANSLAQGFLLAVLVAFPAGRVASRTGWAIIGFGFVAVVGSNLLAAASVATRRAPGLEGPNPLYVTMDPATRSALLAISQLAVFAGLMACTVWLVVRWWRASGPARRTYLPVFGAAIAIATILFASELVLRGGGLSQAERTLVATVEILSFALLPAGILVGVLRDRIARGAVADLVVELGDAPTPGRLREALVSALGDPTLEIVYRTPDGGGFVDSHGASVELPVGNAGRAVTLLERDGEPFAAIVHDPALTDDPGLVAAVGSAVRLAVENERLTAEVRARLAEVQASRTRIVEAADAERRRVERNLHDGAQQRLVALSLALRRAQAQLPPDAARESAETLDEAARQLKSALTELRELARGIHPAILTEAGLGPALRALARESPVPVETDVALPDDVPDAIGVAAYFIAAEALTNVAKYAGATRIELSATTRDGELRLTIDDDGGGGADPAAGSGLRGLEDRVAALGGRIDVLSPAGGGTRISAALPLAARGGVVG